METDKETVDRARELARKLASALDDATAKGLRIEADIGLKQKAAGSPRDYSWEVYLNFERRTNL